MAKSKLQINYKSGRSIKVTVDRFKVTRSAINGSCSFEWENMEPRPLLFGPDDIESVYEL